MNGFFAIGLAEWREACALGLNPAAAFLVLACGTGRDNQTTAWSANAVQEYAGISWVRAKPAIEQLEKAGLLLRAENSTTTKPRYKLRISDDRIWLPKSIVMPLAGEVPALARIRQVQDVMTLRLFVELYYSQNLAADGGLSRSIYYHRYEKSVFCEHGQYTVLGFDPKEGWVSWATEITKVHRIEVTKAEEKAGKSPAQDFFKRIGTLRDLGLLEYAACLFESDDETAEILFPVDGPTSIESAVHTMAEVAAARLLPEWRLAENPHQYLIPVYRHQEKAQLYGIYRLRHRPHTSLTGAWWSTLQERVERTLDAFKTMGG